MCNFFCYAIVAIIVALLIVVSAWAVKIKLFCWLLYLFEQSRRIYCSIYLFERSGQNCFADCYVFSACYGQDVIANQHISLSSWDGIVLLIVIFAQVIEKKLTVIKIWLLCFNLLLLNLLYYTFIRPYLL